jgi:hypothetical protein
LVNIIGIYHDGSLDGKASAAILLHKLPGARLIPANYNGVFDYDGGVSDDVYLMDYCPMPFMRMINLKRSCKRLVWIDNNKEAIEAYEGQSSIMLEGARTVDTASCVLTWQHLFPNRKVPEAIDLVGKYNVHDREDPHVLQFQYGMRAHQTSPESPVWLSVIESHVSWIDEMKHNGRVILDYLEVSGLSRYISPDV